MNYQHYKISLTVPLEKTQCEIVYFHYENMIFHMLIPLVHSWSSWTETETHRPFFRTTYFYGQTLDDFEERKPVTSTAESTS